MVMADARADLLAAAQTLAPELRHRAREGERATTMPADLVAKVKAAGICAMAMPAQLGGLAVDPMTCIEVIEEISRADGSAGWTALIGNSTAFLAWNDPDAIAELVGGAPNLSMTSMFGPLGMAVPDGDDHVVVSGRWPCNSGSPHADILQVGVIVPDGPHAGWRFALVRPEDGHIIDGSWDVAGLKGTGSHDLTIEGARIPLGWLSMPMDTPALYDGPLHRIPFWQLIIGVMGGFPLGVARRALDELEALAPTKRRGASSGTVAEDPHVQYEVGKAEAALQAARAFLFDAADEVWTAATSGHEIPDDSLQRYSLAGRFAMSAAIEAVSVAFHAGGAGVIYDDQPLQRCFRDIHAANQHMFFADSQYAGYGARAMTPPAQR